MKYGTLRLWIPLLLVCCFVLLPLNASAEKPIPISVSYDSTWVCEGDLIQFDAKPLCQLSGTLYLVDNPDKPQGDKYISIQLYDENNVLQSEFKKEISTIPPDGKINYLLNLQAIRGDFKVKVIASHLGFEGSLQGAMQKNYMLTLIDRAKIGKVTNCDFRLGIPFSQIEEAWGQPEISASAPYLSWYSYTKKGVNFLDHSLIQVARIESTEPAKRKIHLQDFTSSLGSPKKQIVTKDLKKVYSIYTLDLSYAPFIVVLTPSPTKKEPNPLVEKYAVSLWYNDLDDLQF